MRYTNTNAPEPSLRGHPECSRETAEALFNLLGAATREISSPRCSTTAASMYRPGHQGRRASQPTVLTQVVKER